MKKVTVLMSTFNGEKYVEEQINSILKQKGIDSNFSMQLMIRDDMSTDKTKEILEKYRNNSKIDFLVDDLGNIGVKQSFFQLLRNSPNADLYFFCDQDDIWPQNKILEFIYNYNENSIADQNRPLGFYSDLWIADEFGKSKNIKMSDLYDWSKYSDYEYLSWNYRVTGAAFAINQAAKELATKIPKNVVDKINMHDSFIALLVSIFGKLIFIDKPLLLYRQHNNNVIGASASNKGYFERIRMVFKTVEQFENDGLLIFELIQKLDYSHDEVKEYRIYFSNFETLKKSVSLRKRFVSWKKMSKSMYLNKIKYISLLRAIINT